MHRVTHLGICQALTILILAYDVIQHLQEGPVLEDGEAHTPGSQSELDTTIDRPLRGVVMHTLPGTYRIGFMTKCIPMHRSSDEHFNTDDEVLQT